MWEKEKQVVVDGAKKLSTSVRNGRKNPKSDKLNDEVKDAIEQKEDAWKKMSEVNDKIMRKIYRIYKEENRRIKTKKKKEVNRKSGKKMNQYVGRNMKLFWEEVGKMKSGKALE